MYTQIIVVTAILGMVVCALYIADFLWDARCKVLAPFKWIGKRIKLVMFGTKKGEKK